MGERSRMIEIKCPRCKKTRTVRYYVQRKTDYCAKCSRVVHTPPYIRRTPE